MLHTVARLTILLNGILICYLLTTDQQTLLYAFCLLELSLILFVIIRPASQKNSRSPKTSSTKKTSSSQKYSSSQKNTSSQKYSTTRTHVQRLASLTYSKMEVYYKKTLNNAMCASCKHLLSSLSAFLQTTSIPSSLCKYSTTRI